MVIALRATISLTTANFFYGIVFLTEAHKVSFSEYTGCNFTLFYINTP